MNLKNLLFAFAVSAFPVAAYASYNSSCNFDISNDDSEWETDGCRPNCSDYDVRYVNNDNDDSRCQISSSNNRCQASMRSRDGSECRVKFNCEVRCHN